MSLNFHSIELDFDVKKDATKIARSEIMAVLTCYGEPDITLEDLISEVTLELIYGYQSMSRDVIGRLIEKYNVEDENGRSASIQPASSMLISKDNISEESINQIVEMIMSHIEEDNKLKRDLIQEIISVLINYLDTDSINSNTIHYTQATRAISSLVNIMMHFHERLQIQHQEKEKNT